MNVLYRTAFPSIWNRMFSARHHGKDQICQSVSAVIMFIFQYSSNPAHHCQLLECLMTLKQSVLKDILSAIAYGTSTARSSAAKLLFYYWPAFNPNLFDRKGLICKLGSESRTLQTHRSGDSVWFQVTRHLSCAKETCVRIPEMPKRRRCATITVYRLSLPVTLLHLCICALSAPTKFTGNIQTKIFSTSCIPCSRFRWSARTRLIFCIIFNSDRDQHRLN